MWQKHFYLVSILVLLILFIGARLWFYSLYFLISIIPLIGLGIMDTYSKNNVLYNYPVIGHSPYLMEFIRPEIRQYFLEDDRSGRPYNRKQRDLINTRAHGAPGTRPFGTEKNIKKFGYSFIQHSIAVKEVPQDAARVRLGAPQCKHHYDNSRLNI